MKRMLADFMLIPNILFITLLLWLLSFIGQYFYESEDNLDKNENLECGFENIELGESPINYKNLLVFIFLIIYDIELFLLLPLSFNVLYCTLSSNIYCYLIILSIIIYTCLFDVETGILEYDN